MPPAKASSPKAFHCQVHRTCFPTIMPVSAPTAFGPVHDPVRSLPTCLNAHSGTIRLLSICQVPEMFIEPLSLDPGSSRGRRRTPLNATTQAMSNRNATATLAPTYRKRVRFGFERTSPARPAVSLSFPSLPPAVQTGLSFRVPFPTPAPTDGSSSFQCLSSNSNP